MRQARGAEHQRQRQRDEVQLGEVAGAELLHRLQQLRVAGSLDGLAEQRRQVEVGQREHPDGHHGGAGDEQGGLDDLHPGGALHAADQHVDDHQRTDDRDDQVLAPLGLHVQQQRHQTARAGHLGQQVEERHRERRRGGRDPDRTLAQPEAEHVGHGELAGVAELLGDQQQRDQPRHQEADGVQEAVVAVDRDGPGDAEEAGRRQVVAGDRGAVLGAGERAPGGVVVSRGLGVARGADDDGEGDADEQQEDRDVDDGVADRGLDRGGHGQRAHRISPSSRRTVAAISAAWRSRFLLAQRM